MCLLGYPLFRPAEASDLAQFCRRFAPGAAGQQYLQYQDQRQVFMCSCICLVVNISLHQYIRNNTVKLLSSSFQNKYTMWEHI